MFVLKFIQIQPTLYEHIYPSITQLCRQPLDKLKELDEKIFVLKVKTLIYSNRYNSSFNVTNWLPIIYCLVIVFEFPYFNFCVQGTFLNLGFEWFASMTGHSSIDALTRAFPSKVTCFYSDPLHTNLGVDCFVLSNQFIAKVYLFIWLWLFFMAIASIWFVLERIVYITCTRFRVWYIEQIVPTIHDKPSLKEYATKNVHDWYMFFLLSKGMSAQKFNKMMCLIDKHSNDDKQEADQKVGQEM